MDVGDNDLSGALHAFRPSDRRQTMLPPVLPISLAFVTASTVLTPDNAGNLG